EDRVVLVLRQERADHRDGRAGGRGPELERQQHERQQYEVGGGLTAAAELRGGPVGVQRAAEEHGLEEDHASVPHPRGRADERGQELPDERLDQEQERGSDEQGGGVEGGEQRDLRGASGPPSGGGEEHRRSYRMGTGRPQ